MIHEDIKPFLVRNGAIVKLRDDAPEEIKKKYQRGKELFAQYMELKNN